MVEPLIDALAVNAASAERILEVSFQQSKGDAICFELGPERTLKRLLVDREQVDIRGRAADAMYGHRGRTDESMSYVGALEDRDGVAEQAHSTIPRMTRDRRRPAKAPKPPGGPPRSEMSMDTT